MTVSKALRNAPDVSATTKTQIKLLLSQLGYVPDSSAQGLRTAGPNSSAWVSPRCQIRLLPGFFWPLKSERTSGGGATMCCLPSRSTSRSAKRPACNAFFPASGRPVHCSVYRIATEARILQGIGGHGGFQQFCSDIRRPSVHNL